MQPLQHNAHHDASTNGIRIHHRCRVECVRSWRVLLQLVALFRCLCMASEYSATGCVSARR